MPPLHGDFVAKDQNDPLGVAVFVTLSSKGSAHVSVPSFAQLEIMLLLTVCTVVE